MNHTETAKKSIENFCLNIEEYILVGASENLKILGGGDSNQVYGKSKSYEADISIDFGSSGNSIVFLGSNVFGNIHIGLTGSNSRVFVGNNCVLNNLEIQSRQQNDFVAIGHNVSTTGSNVWQSGYRSGNSNPAIIIGDDCMFAASINLMNTDAHPIFDLETDQQINQPIGNIHIEPHVWVGNNVSILKSVTIGACSIVALGSIVTKNAARFSMVKGAPAKSTVQEGLYWSRGYTEHARAKAKYFMEKYRR